MISLGVTGVDNDTFVVFGCCNNLELSVIVLSVAYVPEGIEPT
jgi:hypothetical protein